jgi:conjugal transfer/entry exclusion protein
MMKDAEPTLPAKPPGAGQISTEAYTVGAQLVAVQQKQGHKMADLVVPSGSAEAANGAKKQVISKRQHLSPPERVC